MRYLNMDEKRGLRKKCKCGRFNVRRIVDKSVPSERIEIPKTQSIGSLPDGFVPMWKSRPHPDGLCERCATYGTPDYVLSNTIGGNLRESYSRGDEAVGRRLLERIGLDLNERRKLHGSVK